MSARSKCLIATATAIAWLASAIPANAAIGLGETFTPEAGTCNLSVTALEPTSPPLTPYKAPSAGVITSWSFRAGATPPVQLKFKVADPEGGNNFQVVGESDMKTGLTAATLHVFPSRIPISANDVIGLFINSGDCARSMSGHSLSGSFSDVPVGTTADFGVPGSNQQLDLAAVLEPDTDGDGFGDETQDACGGQAGPDGGCPVSPPPGPDTSAPDTTITKRPDAKTKDKKAGFEFISSEAGSAFECSVDVEPFAPCSSPFEETVGKGRHTFQVRAVDAAGNVDESPASAVWEFKKKKKKKKK